MIEVINLCKRFPEKQVLKNVSIKIEDGEIFSVIGPSGVGKSTFIKCIVRLLKSDSGDIMVDGTSITITDDEFALAKVRRKFGYLFQEGALFDSLTVMQNVSFGLKYLTNIHPSKYPEIVSEKLALVGLSNVEDLKPAELSVGMKKRVALARAIASEPKYILYDEPTTGLDPITAEMVTELILDMKEKLKVTCIVVTHDVKLALRISNRVAMLYDGRFVVIETPENFRNSKNPTVQEFIEISERSGKIIHKLKY
jgi:phospholipid/cholesterol/gamma-HCH transport system ATP-binding protein